MTGTGYSYSKISLSLAITGYRDNYHELDMITIPYKKHMDSVSFKANLEAKDILDISLTTTIISIDKSRFIEFIKDKLTAICEFYGIYGSFEINKGVPLGGGIGGSACPIAAAIKAVEKVVAELNIDKKMSYEDMIKLGSDVPCVYFNKPCRVQGIGEIITPIKDEKYYYVEHLIPTGVDTKKAYAIYDANRKDDQYIPTTIKEAIEKKRNDLEYSAITLNSSVKSTFEKLKQEGKDVIVSGCGSTIFEISKEKIS